MSNHDEALPQQIGKYRILSILGEGGMGIVYKAIDPNIEQQVALKVIRPEILQRDHSKTMLKRFRNEVLACRRLKHENIVSTFDYQESEEYCFIVMELVEGRLLSDFIKQDKQFEPSQIVDLISQLLSALDYAHQKGVIHRDIKPDNISINDDGSIQVMDFGIAKLDTSNVTMMGSFLGSPGYMSPEQCQEQEVDQRSDIFSVGALLYQLLTGKKPFAADTMAIVLQKTLTETPEKPSAINSALSPAFDKVVAKALAKQAKKRYQSAAEFRNALMAIVPDSTNTTQGSVITWKSGLVAFSLVGIGVAWTVYQNSFKSGHSSAVAIVEPVQEPTTVNRAAQFEQLLQTLPCNTLKITQPNNQGLLIEGTVLPQDLERVQKRIQTLLQGLPYETRITGLNRPFCDVIGFLEPFYQHNQQQRAPIKIRPYQHSKQFFAGETVQFEITTGDSPIYLYADYYAADGALFHLYPTALTEIKPFKAQQTFILGEGRISFEVSPPFGTDLVTLIASRVPLFDSIQQDSDSVSDYLSALNTNFKPIKNQTILADYIYISTEARPE